jgi:hypothetical protein
MAKTIYELVDELPVHNMTTRLLGALDWVVPGAWKNIVGFENTITAVTGETDQAWMQKIGERAIHLYNDASQGYQRAQWLYQTIDSTQAIAGAAALVDKIGENVGFLSFLRWLTPKADRTQTIDVSLKVIVELIAFCQLNGIPGDGIGDFVESLADYRHEALMRMAALVCMDGIVPLGPDFVSKALASLQRLGASGLADNKRFQHVQSVVPGSDAQEKFAYISRGLDAVQGWVGSFIASKELGVDKIVGSLHGFADSMDGKLDYVAAFVDIATNYFEHTGTQTVARSLISRAASEV